MGLGGDREHEGDGGHVDGASAAADLEREGEREQERARGSKRGCEEQGPSGRGDQGGAASATLSPPGTVAAWAGEAVGDERERPCRSNSGEGDDRGSGGWWRWAGLWCTVASRPKCTGAC